MSTTAISDHEMYEKLRFKKYTVRKTFQKKAYTINVTFKGTMFTTQRRYAEFDKLYNWLKKKFPNDKFKLPEKKFFGNMERTTIENRKKGFDVFLTKLLSDQKYYQEEKVLAFLGLVLEGEEDEDVSSYNGQDDNADDDNVDLGCMEKKCSVSSFEFMKMIGKGSFGKVYLARCKVDKEFYAIKVLSKKEIKARSGGHHVLTEKSVLLKSIKHPFLCGLHYAFQSRFKLYFVLPYINGGELFFHLQRMRTFPEPHARFYAAEMATAIGYLHSNNILYRDLKPENILLDAQGHVILTDFGLSKEGVQPTETTSTFCGTSEYLAPEILQKEPYNRGVDWWCFGCVLYEMLFGLPPFYSRDFSQMFESIKHKQLVLKSTCSDVARSFLTGLLEKDHRQRLGSMSDFDELRRHEFFADIDWTKLLNKQIPPPFKPAVDSPKDVANFEVQFTKEVITASVMGINDDQNFKVSVQDDDEFVGFSYRDSI